MAASDKMKQADEQAKKTAAKEKERIAAAAHKVEAEAKERRAKIHARIADAEHHGDHS